MILFRTSKNGVDLIKTFESCKLTAYKDLAGIWTIGWGDTGPDVVCSLKITQDQADKRLEKKLLYFENIVNRTVRININQHQFDALVSFCYNVGQGSLEHSTLMSDLNHANYSKASQDFLDWDKVNGHVVAGLLRRRKAESTLFLRDDFI